MELTYHAIERMKERLNVKSAKRMQSIAEKAYLYGLREIDCDHRTKKVFEQLAQNESYNSVDARIYQDRAFIFNKGGNLITVYPISKEYQKAMQNRRAKSRMENSFLNKKGFADEERSYSLSPNYGI